VGALGLNELIKRRIDVKVALAGIALLGLLWGGGAMTYILRSSDSWYWHSNAVRTANHALQRVFGPITPGNNDPNEFLGFN